MELVEPCFNLNLITLLGVSSIGTSEQTEQGGGVCGGVDKINVR